MPGFLLHLDATVTCSHSGQAQPRTTNLRLLVSGHPTVTIKSSYNITGGCTLPPPPSGNGPCVSAQFTSAATRVSSNGQALLLTDSQATCAPTGTPLIIGITQTRVTGI
jgi:hypothetical protein